MEGLDVKLSDICPDRKQIGAGGFGEVFLVQHRNWGPCVIKRLKSEKIKRHGGELEKVQKEALMLIHLRHPNIAYIMGVICDPAEPSILMEHVHHGSLDAFIKRFVIAVELKLKFISEVILGMNYLHTKTPPIIHRDLKLANVLVSDSYHCKIADFGLAEHKPQSDDALTYGLAGTPAYIAPEGLAMSCCIPNEKFDVYAFGILIWELMVQSKPFEGERLASVTPKVIGGERPPLYMYQASVAGHPEVAILEVLMKQAWDADPAIRPDFREMKERVDAVIEKTAVNLSIQEAETMLHERVIQTPLITAVLFPLAQNLDVAVENPAFPPSPVYYRPGPQAIPPREQPVNCVLRSESLETKRMEFVNNDQYLPLRHSHPLSDLSPHRTSAPHEHATFHSDPVFYGKDFQYSSACMVTPGAELHSVLHTSYDVAANLHVENLQPSPGTEPSDIVMHMGSSAFQSKHIAGHDRVVQSHVPGNVPVMPLKTDALQDSAGTVPSSTQNVNIENAHTDAGIYVNGGNGINVKLQSQQQLQGSNIFVHRAQNVVIGDKITINIPGSSRPGQSVQVSATGKDLFTKPPKTQLKVKKGIVDLPSLQTIASKLGNSYPALGRALGLTDSDLDYIRADYASISGQEVAYQVLRQWREKKGPDASYSALANGLLKACRADLAKLLSTGVS